jgi:trehalose 6-phosphate synthase
MNLVAKEGPVVNDRDGVLLLSRGAGAFDELGTEAVALDAFDVSGTAAAMAAALAMPAEERRRRATRIAELAGALPPGRWHDEVIAKARRPVS